MATVYRVTAIWNGFQGAPGYTKFSFAQLTTDVARNAAGSQVRAYFSSLNGFLQTGWNVLVQPEIQEFDEATGQLTGASNMTTPPVVVNGLAAPGAYAGGSGFVVTWKTGIIYNGRRVIGRTFHVPAVTCFDTDGTLTPTALSTIGGAAQTLVSATAAELGVWSRVWSKPVPPAKPIQIAGLLSIATSTVVKDAASQLRSRRN